MTPEEVINAADKLLHADVCQELEIRSALHPEKLTQDEREAHLVFSLLYRLIHSHNTRASCYRVHGDWRAESEKVAATG